MHGRRGHHGWRHFGPGFRRHRFPNREQWLEALEEYQRDLEQEVADVADLIRHLKAQGPETATA
jgi:hypothetical protein